jgi:hypothetical protein
MDWIAHVTEALFSAYRRASKLPDDVLAVEGYSSPLVRRLLNNLCDFEGCRYVEGGTWQGRRPCRPVIRIADRSRRSTISASSGGPSCATTSWPRGTCTRPGIAWTRHPALPRRSSRFPTRFPHRRCRCRACRREARRNAKVTGKVSRGLDIRSPMRWLTLMARGSCIGTSSPRTCCWTPREPSG